MMKGWWLFWLDGEETDMNGMEWHRDFRAMLGFCNDTKLNFIMGTGSLLNRNFLSL